MSRELRIPESIRESIPESLAFRDTPTSARAFRRPSLLLRISNGCTPEARL